MNARNLLSLLFAMLLLDLPVILWAEETGSVSAAADTYVNGFKPDRNFGSNTFMQVRTWGETTSYVRFDFASDFPTVVEEAQLTLEVHENIKPQSIEIHRVLTPWDEGDVTFMTRPSSVQIGSVDVAAGDAEVTTDVTSLVNGWGSGAFDNYGVALVPIASTTDGVNVLFHTRESGTGSAPTLDYELFAEVFYRGYELWGEEEVGSYETYSYTVSCGAEVAGSEDAFDSYEKQLGLVDQTGNEWRTRTVFDWTPLGAGWSTEDIEIRGDNSICVELREDSDRESGWPIVPVQAYPVDDSPYHRPGWRFEFRNMTPCTIEADSPFSFQFYVQCRGVYKGLDEE